MVDQRSPTFGQLLRRFRQAAGITQEMLGRQAGLSARGISDLERGARRAPHPYTIRKLADALGLRDPDRVAFEAAARRPGLFAAPEGGPAHNLPAAATSFIGREPALAEVRRLLGTTRLLTLVGPGGVGKSRLAVEAARLTLDARPHGTWLVELAAVADPGLVSRAVATVLGIREQPHRPLVATIAETLRDRELLLVLDNCEHLRTACAELAEALLRAAPGLRILATSRVPLGLTGETTWRVPSLSLPRLPSSPDEEKRLPRPGPFGPSPSPVAAESEAVRLFCTRADAALPGFALTDANAVAISAICHHLDGLPLALELAAPWIRVLPVEEIARRLATSLELLGGPGLTRSSRYQTLNAALDWSYGLLGEPERRLLERLAVFAGSFTLAAAEVVGIESAGQVVPVVASLARLVEASLVGFDPATGRYHLLETVRHDAWARLQARGDLAAVRRRHADYYRDLALAALPALWDSHPERDRWFDELERDLDNVRAAWGFADETGDVATTLWLGGALAPLFNMRGYLVEARARLADALACSADDHPRARAWALLAAGSLARSDEEPDEAARHLAASIDLFRAVDDAAGLAHALVILGTTYAWWGDAATARPLLEEALALGRASPRGPGVGIPLFQLGLLALFDGDDERAEALLEEGLPALRARGDLFRVSHVLFALGFAAVARGRPAAARAHLAESLAIVLDRRDPWGLAFVLEGFACLLAANAPERALRLAGAADAVRERWDLRVSTRALLRVRDRLLQPARDALGPAAASAAFATGRTAPIDQVLDELVGEDLAAEAPRL